MLFAFRSLVIAVNAIVLNLLSVAAAYGVLVLVFQHGLGKGLLGFNSTAGIDPVVPLLLFVILFGLSMDYHVFIISRIRETFDRGASTDDATAHGIKSTAGVVTSAAIVMVAVFAIFGDALDAVLQAVRRRALGGDPDRRDDRPRRAPAGNDEAARQLELVPAPLARVASPRWPRVGAGTERDRVARRRIGSTPGTERPAKAGLSVPWSKLPASTFDPSERSRQVWGRVRGRLAREYTACARRVGAWKPIEKEHLPCPSLSSERA